MFTFYFPCLKDISVFADAYKILSANILHLAVTFVQIQKKILILFYFTYE